MRPAPRGNFKQHSDQTWQQPYIPCEGLVVLCTTVLRRMEVSQQAYFGTALQMLGIICAIQGMNPA